jgi:hypothetical protein
MVRVTPRIYKQTQMAELEGILVAIVLTDKHGQEAYAHNLVFRNS